MKIGVSNGISRLGNRPSFIRSNVPDFIARKYISDHAGFVNTAWMDSGTPYARFGATGTVATDAATPYNKIPNITHNSLKVTADGTVNFTDVRASIAGINTTGKIPVFAVYCPDFSKITELQFSVGTSGLTNRRRWNAIQGNQGNRWIEGSDWQVVCLPWQEGVDAGSGATRTNVTDYQFRVQSNGQGAVDIWIGAVGWINAGNAYGTVSFDDGYSSVFTAAWPVLQTNSVKFTIYVPAQYVDSGPTRLSLAQIKTMTDSGLCEVGYHGDGNDQRVYTANQLRRIIESDLIYWASKGYTIKTGAYPGGEDDATTDSVLIRNIYAEYFQSARMIFQGQAEVSSPGDYLRLKVSSYITNVVTTATVLTNINNTVAEKGVHHQVYHDIVSSTADITTKYLLSDFTTNIANLAGSSLIKAKVSETLP